MTIFDIFEKLPQPLSSQIQERLDATAIPDSADATAVWQIVDSIVVSFSPQSDSVQQLLDQVPDAVVKAIFN